MINLIYYLFFALTLGSALMVVFLRHAVYSALSLVVTMVSIAGIFILINAQLAAFFQILVYAGAIMVLFLFVIMLLNLRHSPPMPGVTRSIRRAGAVLLGVLLIQLLILGVRSGATSMIAEQAKAATTASGKAPEGATITEVALILLTDYLYAFEMTSVLLLVAVIGAMVLARRSISGERNPNLEDSQFIRKLPGA